MSLIAVDLKLAFREPGCPVCRLRNESEARYIFSLLYEYVNDPGVREHLLRSLGFCHLHAWEMQATEQELWGSGLGSSIIYEHLLSQALAGLQAYLIQINRRSRRASWGSRLKAWMAERFGLNGHVPDPVAAALPVGLVPQERCRACQMGDQAEERDIHTLVEMGAEPEFRDWYRASDGLCLPHLRQALAFAERQGNIEVARFLAEVSEEKLERLTRDLREYIRKHAWQFRHEPKLEREQHSWIEAIAFFIGEKREPGKRRRRQTVAGVPESEKAEQAEHGATDIRD